MSRHTSRTRRALVQMDLAFWYLHAHFGQLTLLAAPTIVAVCGIAATLVAILQNWDLPPLLLYILFAILLPTLVVWVGTFLPLPSAVFAWRRASGTLPETGECFRHCLSRSSRLVPVAFKLFFAYLLWFTFFGVPLLYFGPRTCAAPAIALFEKERHIFRRSRRLMKEDVAINVLGALYFSIFLALGLLLFLPRIFLSSQGRFVASGTSRWILDHLWIAEICGGVVLISAIAVGWCISMTLLYREVRIVREGESLREKIEQVRHELLGAPAGESALS